MGGQIGLSHMANAANRNRLVRDLNSTKSQELDTGQEHPDYATQGTFAFIYTYSKAVHVQVNQYSGV